MTKKEKEMLDELLKNKVELDTTKCYVFKVNIHSLESCDLLQKLAEAFNKVGFKNFLIVPITDRHNWDFKAIETPEELFEEMKRLVQNGRKE